MDLSGRVGQEGYVKFGIVCGIHDASVGVTDSNGLRGRAFIEDRCVHSAEVGGASGVGDDSGGEAGRRGKRETIVS